MLFLSQTICFVSTKESPLENFRLCTTPYVWKGKIQYGPFSEFNASNSI